MAVPRRAAAILLAAACAFLAGCAGGGGAAPAGGAASEPDVPQPAREQTELRVLRLNEEDANCAGTESGYYSIVPYRADYSAGMNTSAWILYTDYAARTTRLLCDTPGCAHADQSCTGWLQGTPYAYWVADTGSELLLVQYTGAYERPEGGAQNSAVYLMDYDGSNRRLLCAMNGTENIDFFCAADGRYLYIQVTDMPEGVDWQDLVQWIVRVDLQTGERSDLAGMPLYANTPIGVRGGEIVLRRENSDTGPAREWTYRIVLFDVYSAAERPPILEFSLETSVFVRHSGDYIYVSGVLEPGITRYHMDTGESTYISFAGENRAYDAGRKIWDGKLVYYTSETFGEGAGMRQHTIWADLATGQTDSFDMYYTTTVQDDDLGLFETYPVEMLPLAETGEYYLVYIDYVVESGVPTAAVQALIKKEDYWAGREVFIPIAGMG